MNFTFSVLLFLVLLGEVTSECCRPPCSDGTFGSPYCGVGRCNMFGCNCNGGCRRRGSDGSCCRHRNGKCADGTKPTPFCGYGKCNIIGCNCDGGCRKGGPCCFARIFGRAAPILAAVGAAAADSLNSNIVSDVYAVTTNPIKVGTFWRCADGSKGSPYCGVGKCNIIGCNCDGGCRK